MLAVLLPSARPVWRFASRFSVVTVTPAPALIVACPAVHGKDGESCPPTSTAAPTAAPASKRRGRCRRWATTCVHPSARNVVAVRRVCSARCTSVPRRRLEPALIGAGPRTSQRARRTGHGRPAWEQRLDDFARSTPHTHPAPVLSRKNRTDPYDHRHEGPSLDGMRNRGGHCCLRGPGTGWRRSGGT